MPNKINRGINTKLNECKLKSKHSILYTQFIASSSSYFSSICLLINLFIYGSFSLQHIVAQTSQYIVTKLKSWRLVLLANCLDIFLFLSFSCALPHLYPQE